MNNEQLLQMYDAIRQQPDLLVKAAARKRLINFARYMQPDLVLEPFHVVYYTLLDMFAHGKIRKMIVQQPPQHGKSEGSSRKLPAFMLGLDPDRKIVPGLMLFALPTFAYCVGFPIMPPPVPVGLSRSVPRFSIPQNLCAPTPPALRFPNPPNT